MGRKLDLSGLTDDEAEHVLKVVQRDMKLRKKEEERLSEMKQELDEEDSRCSILSKQNKFNEHCCIRCCSPFTFLLNPKRQCLECQYNVCKSCRTYCKKDKAWLCSVCQKSRILRTQSLEWYYNNVKSRFKRFGSAKVLKTLYRKHIVDRGAYSELIEGSINEGSVDNEGSACGSDSTFYTQSEGHSMADTLTVALRVAEEAIEEAIAKAEDHGDSIEKQNEARYLRDNKEELIEELATTIVQKIIQRRKRSGMQAEYEMVWPLAQGGELPSPTQSQQSPQTHQASLKTSYSLWRSRSAFSLTSDDSPDKPADPGENSEVPEGARKGSLKEYVPLKKEGRTSQMSSWKSVDRLDNSCASSVLQSPDGNWIALQSSQLSRPSLLTKRKSLVFSVLEKESGVVSAYDEMGSDTEDEDPGGWIAALHEFRRKMSDETYYTDSQHDPEWTYTQNPPVTSPSSGQYTNTETLNSDSESSSVPLARNGPAKHRKPLLSLLQRKGTPEPLHPPHPHQLDALDINFNPKVAGSPGAADSSEAEDKQSDPIRRSRRRRRSKREAGEQARGNQTQYSSSVPDYSSFSLSSMARREEVPPSPGSPPDTVIPDTLTSEAVTPNAVSQERESRASRDFSTAATLELKTKLSELVDRATSKKTTTSEEGLAEGERPAEKGEERLDKEERDRARAERIEKVAKREWERVKEEILERRVGRLVEKEGERGEGRLLEEERTIPSEKAMERLEERELDSEEERLDQGEKEAEGNRTTRTSQDSAPLVQEELLSAEDIRREGSGTADLQQKLQVLSSFLQQKYSAASLCSITTEVLKVLNATEELIEEAGGEGHVPSESADASPLPSSSSTKRLDEQLTKLEENVYLAAGTVYGLEGELGDLEECARAISSGTTEKELAYLEDQVASAAAQVQQSELQISDIEARITALKTAGLNVVPCMRGAKYKPKPKPQTIGSSRMHRRKLPAPPLRDKDSKEELQFRPPRP
ncbi:rab effector MyRIP isoform X1 [Megalops cyprinoides]|uniref:rab effector MyRIP isoform X1 n=1 Tax=Megalops cyprinoides TaxID=118141 RepID=UPI0018652798|nr:rab effector MyRIP isoform X1 [Megalops cyprinoides]